MHRIVKRAGPLLSLLLTAASLSGCNSFDGDAVRSKQASWRALGIQDYAFVWFQGCFCGIPDIKGIRVEVRAGVPSHAVGVSTGLPQPESAITLDDIFKRVLDFGSGDPYESSIVFDAQNHFITRFTGDAESNAEDDGLTLEVRCFSRDVDAGCPVQALTSEACLEKGGTPTPLTLPSPTALGPCSGQWPGPSGQISGSDAICCIKQN